MYCLAVKTLGGDVVYVYLRINVNFCFTCSYVFWMGDLNFRIDDMDVREIIKDVEDGNFSKLLERDQVCCYIMLR